MSAEDRIYEAVKEAVWRGMLPKDFVSVVRAAWRDEINEKLRHDIEDFNYMLRTPTGSGAP